MVIKIRGIFYLVGITSAGVSCAYQDGLYTLVAAHIPWIINAMNTYGDGIADEICDPPQRHLPHDPVAYRNQEVYTQY